MRVRKKRRCCGSDGSDCSEINFVLIMTTTDSLCATTLPRPRRLSHPHRQHRPAWFVSCLLCFLLAHLFSYWPPLGDANPDAKRLYDDLLSNYNRLIRPVGNNSDRLTVKLGLKLSQLIDVNLKNQIMTTNVWVEQKWNDYKLMWNPEDYGGVETLHVPSEHIWLPDIVLYNNADGNYEVTIMTKAILHFSGEVFWKPPAIYKSSCEIDVEYFPFDEQTCFMKFGSWTYDGYMVDLQHIHQTADSNLIDIGIDLRDYYLSVEWDIMKVPAVRNEKFYSCCEEPYPDIIFNITLRRKTLFYTVNLIIPCVGISFLSVLVFYLPSDSGEKVSLCISILLSLTVFFLLLAEIIPPTSLTVPLLGKYLLFTMILVTFSVVLTVMVLNVNFRSPATHKMAPWVRRVFIEFLPKYLFIERPKKEDDDNDEVHDDMLDAIATHGSCGMLKPCDDLDPAELDGLPGANGGSDIGGASNKMMDVFDVQEFGSKFYGRPAPPNNNSGGDTTPPHFHHFHHHHHHDLFDVGNEASEATFLNDVGNDDLFGIGGDTSPLSDVAGGATTATTTTTVTGLLGGGGATSGYSSTTRGAMSAIGLAPEFSKAISGIRFIAQHRKNEDKYAEIEEDWKYVAMVLDRLFLWIFTMACIVGTAAIIFQAPALYDTTIPIDVQYSKIAKRKMMKMSPEEDPIPY